MNAFFSLRGIGFAVPGHVLLQPTDLTVSRGSVVGLIGHNGSGKSTLVRMLAGLERPSRGEIHLDGRPMDSWGSRAFGRKIAFMAQTLPPTDGMLVRELVALGRYPWLGPFGRPRERDRAAVADALTMAGVNAFSERLVDTLSGGERQRTWLAMLLAQQPECLLLDEPTSALDIAHQISILTLVQRLSRDKGFTVVIVLHDVNMAARFCDRIVALHTGRKILEGEPDEILQVEALRRIYDVDFDVYKRHGDVRSFALVS